MALTGFRNSCEMTLIMNSCCRLNVDEVGGGGSAQVVDRNSENEDGLLLVGFLAQLLCFLETRTFVCDGDFLQSLGVRDVGVGHDNGGDVFIDVSQRDLDDRGWTERSALIYEKFRSRRRGRAICVNVQQPFVHRISIANGLVSTWSRLKASIAASFDWLEM